MSNMNKMQNGLWWYLLRTIRGKVYKLRSHSGPANWTDPTADLNTLLRTAIEEGDPKMITRFGITEISCLISYQDLYLRQQAHHRVRGVSNTHCTGLYNDPNAPL